MRTIDKKKKRITSAMVCKISKCDLEYQLNWTFSVSFGLVYPQFEDLQHVEVEGVWQIVFSTFLVYSMLPLR